MRRILFILLASLFAIAAYGAGAPADAPWPKGAMMQVDLKLSTGKDTNGHATISGAMLIRNPNEKPLLVQSPRNRMVLAFVVIDELGNVVAPTGRAKVDRGFESQRMAGRTSHVYHFETLDFLTGSALFGYNLDAGKTYRVVAIYRPSGASGPGFSSSEVQLAIPK